MHLNQGFNERRSKMHQEQEVNERVGEIVTHAGLTYAAPSHQIVQYVLTIQNPLPTRHLKAFFVSSNFMSNTVKES